MEARILQEGYGPGAWHGPDLKAAVADVDGSLAFWRPAKGRHNIAEIALHHAFVLRNVRAQLSGKPAEEFVLEGDDWFEVGNDKALSWKKVLTTLESQQEKLATLVAGIEADKIKSPVAEGERFNVVLGTTCHAVYHAGQINLIKRLRGD
jgi:hypothetical protein